MKTGIIVAMEKELRQLLALLPEVKEEAAAGMRFFAGRAVNKELFVVQSGVGKVNAAVATTELIDRYHPDFIIYSGVAGGARNDILPLDTVASETVAYHDVYCGGDCAFGQVQGLPAVFQADEKLLKIAASIEGVKTGLFATGDWFVDSRQKAETIIAHWPEAIAFDMESAAIAQACFIRRVPFISLRTISDNPLHDGHREQYAGFWERLANGSFRVLKTFLEKC
ncbi:MAG: 5'-methylthioadenosine/adenosylhomocysteine nucleosidase [Prevotella sp.]|nr:5'-methylthioadenosine/adenosylhomocysteine nucleosidase [Prevotella sp.]